MEEFKIKREIRQSSEDDLLGVDYANQFTDLNHEKMDELNKVAVEVEDAIEKELQNSSEKVHSSHSTTEEFEKAEQEHWELIEKRFPKKVSDN